MPEHRTPKPFKVETLHSLLGRRGRLSSLGKTIEKIIDRIRGAERPEVAEAVEEAPAGPPQKVYFKALPLRDLEDVDAIKREVKSGNIIVARVTPLAKKSVEDVKRAVSELSEFTQLVGGDIARLGEERVVITPSFVRIWRRRAVAEEGVPTAA